jgi:hypothetical protein
VGFFMITCISRLRTTTAETAASSVIGPESAPPHLGLRLPPLRLPPQRRRLEQARVGGKGGPREKGRTGK